MAPRLLALALYLALAAPTLCAALSLWPWPQQISSGSQAAVLATNFSFVCASPDPAQCVPVLYAAFARYESALFVAGLPDPAPSSQPQVTELQVVVDAAAPLELGVDESYSLSVSASGEATLKAATQWGAMRGLETFSQLFVWSPAAAAPAVEYWCEALPLTISDWPRFAWRGVLIDSSRHFLTTAAILRTLDAMSYNKFNVLHWHITDDNSFPLYSDAYPALAEQGAYSPSSIYRHADVEAIVNAAYERGIRVLPEFDVPGHASSWGKGEPSIVAQCDGGQTLIDPSGPFYPVLAGLLSEFASLFTDGFLHLGGDEVETFQCWDASPTISAFRNAHNWTDTQLRNYFQVTVQQVAANAGKDAVFWEEVFDQGFQLDPSSVVNVWLSQAKLLQVVQSGLRGVYSFGWYLDQQTPPGPQHYLWEDTWMNFYANDPVGNATLSPAQLALVLGGEASQWGEQVDAANIESRMWPRAAAVAERLWSAQSVTDVDAAAQRLSDQRCAMVRRGIGAGPIRPGDTYGNCDLPPTSRFARYP